jgi:hypothetical protein
MDGLDSGFGNGGTRTFKQASNEKAHNLALHFPEADALIGAGELRVDLFDEVGKEFDFLTQSVHGEKAGGEGVIEIGGVVGDFVGEIE